MKFSEAEALSAIKVRLEAVKLLSVADEARWLAERYDAIIGKIHEQMKAQG